MVSIFGWLVVIMTAEARLTPNLFQLALEDFDESLFTGLFRLQSLDDSAGVPSTCVLSDGRQTQTLTLNPRSKWPDVLPVPGEYFVVKFHHAFKIGTNLLYLDKITLFEPPKPVADATLPPADEAFAFLEGRTENFPEKNQPPVPAANGANGANGFLGKRPALDFEDPPERITISQLNLDRKNWTFLARISEKSKLKKYAKSDDHFFDINVADESGTVRIVFWKDTSPKYFEALEEGDLLWFSGFTVKPESKFNKMTVKFELYATPESKLEPPTVDGMSPPRPFKRRQGEAGESQSLQGGHDAPPKSGPTIKAIKCLSDTVIPEITGTLRGKTFGPSRLIGGDGNKSVFLEIEDSTDKIQMEVDQHQINPQEHSVGAAYSIRNVRLATADGHRWLLFEPSLTVIERTCDRHFRG